MPIIHAFEHTCLCGRAGPVWTLRIKARRFPQAQKFRCGCMPCTIIQTCGTSLTSLTRNDGRLHDSLLPSEDLFTLFLMALGALLHRLELATFRLAPKSSHLYLAPSASCDHCRRCAGMYAAKLEFLCMLYVLLTRYDLDIKSTTLRKRSDNFVGLADPVAFTLRRRKPSSTS